VAEAIEPDLAERIARARAEHGLTQEELASDIGLARSALAKIETGARGVSALELARIAEALDVRMEWFVEDAPEPVISRRNVRDPGAPSPVIDRVVERVAREFEFVAQESGLHLESVEGEVPDRPESNTAVEQAAASTRLLLGLEEHEAAYRLERLTERIGLFAFSLELGSETADAASILLAQDAGVAVINGSLSTGRRRLALAHELGHYRYQDEYSVDWRLEDQSGPWEAALDRFARAILLPEAALTERWAEIAGQQGARQAAVRIGSEFRVDMSTLARRLHELGVIPGGDAQAIRSVRTTRADIVEQDLLVADELSPPSIPHLYSSALLTLYKSESISAARAVELSFGVLEEADLPALPSLPENAIWSFTS
jgi:transcriptional regulator with XRE-family HTH domain